jgi:2-polyprenyl-3-methyl-5-hydroxy-6-metoxy-1,4-benzoquinol methylase
VRQPCIPQALTGDLSLETANSPLTGRPARKLRELSAGFLATALEEYYRTTPPPGACEEDYILWECTETGLQFARPAKQGSAVFYEWIGHFPTYYPGQRWEYGKVLELTTQEGLFVDPDSLLLDVGAGRGDFLRRFSRPPKARRLGIDLSENAVRAMEAEGFRAFHGTVDEAVQSNFITNGSCQVVTSFHCLEHVEDPVGFVSTLLALASPEGRVYLSTPKSPMSFEARWFDVLNHPPHHLTRWTLPAYRRLAEEMNCTLRTFCPPASLVRDTLRQFKLIRHGTATVSRMTTVKESILHPFQAMRCIADQIRHRHRYGKPYTDVVLVELRKTTER